MIEKMPSRNYHGPELQITPIVPEKIPESILPPGMRIEDVNEILGILDDEDDDEKGEMPPTLH